MTKAFIPKKKNLILENLAKQATQSTKDDLEKETSSLLEQTKEEKKEEEYVPTESIKEQPSVKQNTTPELFNVVTQQIENEVEFAGSTTNSAVYNELHSIITTLAKDLPSNITYKSLLNGIIYDWLQSNPEKIKEIKKLGKSSKNSLKNQFLG